MTSSMDDFAAFLEYFPAVELPVMLSEEQKDVFEEMNKALPLVLTEKYIGSWESEIDEFTEFIPCFSLPVQKNYSGLVYWKGSLLKYEFILVTLNKSQQLISRKVIASTIVDNNIIKRSVASIESDLSISIIAGHQQGDDLYDVSASALYSIEIMDNGELVFDSNFGTL